MNDLYDMIALHALEIRNLCLEAWVSYSQRRPVAQREDLSHVGVWNAVSICWVGESSNCSGCGALAEQGAVHGWWHRQRWLPSLPKRKPGFQP